MSRRGSIFPLRFEDETTRNALRDIAEQLGVSMNRLAQDAIATQLGLTAMLLEARLEKTLRSLREYRGKWSDAEIAAFAHSEVEYEDPVQGHMLETDESDPLGVLRAFGGPRGRPRGDPLERRSSGLP
jgi:hypothetical protein